MGQNLNNLLKRKILRRQHVQRTNLKSGVPKKKKKKHAKFSGNLSFRLTLCYLCVSGGKLCLFFGRLGVLCFRVTPVLRFALPPWLKKFYDLVFISFEKLMNC